MKLYKIIHRFENNAIFFISLVHSSVHCDDIYTLQMNLFIIELYKMKKGSETDIV